jgi:hypothetical protein
MYISCIIIIISVFLYFSCFFSVWIYFIPIFIPLNIYFHIYVYMNIFISVIAVILMRGLDDVWTCSLRTITFQLRQTNNSL